MSHVIGILLFVFQADNPGKLLHINELMYFIVEMEKEKEKQCLS